MGIIRWHPDYNKRTKQIEPSKATFSEYNDKGLLLSRVEGTVNLAARSLAARGVSELSILSRTQLRQDTSRKTSFEYTDKGQSKGTTAANGATTEYDYDESANRTSTKMQSAKKAKYLSLMPQVAHLKNKLLMAVSVIPLMTKQAVP